MGAAQGRGAATARDARLTVEVAAACVAALVVFVVVPSSVTGFALPPGVDAVWMVGGLLTIFLGPVVAGICGCVSIASLWTRSDVMSTRTLRLHLVTLILVAVVWLGYVSTWGSHVMAWWLD